MFGVDFAEVVPDYGDPRGGGTREHEGQDFRASQGTPIVSPTEGVVIRTGNGASSGRYVYVAAPGGETFRYMHLDEIADIEHGDEVDVGDYLGTVGDTGNVPDGVYHLHFEIRDEDNEPLDPYDCLEADGFSLKDRMSFLRGILRDQDEADEHAEFLVGTFPDDFREAVAREYNLPSTIDAALEDSGVLNQAQAIAALTELVTGLPGALQPGLTVGSQGAPVAVLQLYLIYAGEGPARDALLAAGPTGYFGPITQQALAEHQTAYLLVEEKGEFNAATQEQMLERDNFSLNLE